MPKAATFGSVKPSQADLDRMEERLRAHVRKHMENEGIGPSGVADATGMDQPYVTKWLKKSGTSRTGLSARQAFRIMHGLGIQAWTFFNVDPEPTFWRTYVPHATDGPSRSKPQASTATAPSAEADPRGRRALDGARRETGPAYTHVIAVLPRRGRRRRPPRRGPLAIVLPFPRHKFPP